MIQVTSLRDGKVWLNPDLIETIVSRPDTIVKLAGGNTLLVQESPETITKLILERAAAILHNPAPPVHRDAPWFDAPAGDGTR